ncbi:carbohydrate ABC transporter permease [Variovorax paradoxus]|jgi:multiple sugar transport system permease protein|uniref:carbohydrate ABC transporter permease n=1 Tax=Variovorax paradoxus TaxID=34073 RepID=UPI0029C76A86|nr:carbohydrate ABC transporter permease [Variovorax paradoxus]WPH23717.1 carbohydrate ABC transporter permease [Variovorax paradoxus]
MSAGRMKSLRRRWPLARWAVPLVLFAMLLPFLWLLQMSFKPTPLILEFPPRVFFVPTLEHYVGLWQAGFPESFVNSLVTSIVSTLLALVFGIPAAYALSRWTGRGRFGLGLGILLTRMAPPIAFTIPFFLAYRYLGLLDTRTGLILIYMTFNLPLVIWMMQPFFDAVPASLEEAALMDGAGYATVFMEIVMPMAAAGIAATAILCFLYAWNDFFFALILTRTDARTAPVAVVNFMNYEGWEWGKIAAGGSLVMAPVLVFSMLVRRYLVSGLTAGAVKG